jgi:hypothetical protein
MAKFADLGFGGTLALVQANPGYWYLTQFGIRQSHDARFRNLRMRFEKWFFSEKCNCI